MALSNNDQNESWQWSQRNNRQGWKPSYDWKRSWGSWHSRDGEQAAFAETAWTRGTLGTSRHQDIRQKHGAFADGIAETHWPQQSGTTQDTQANEIDNTSESIGSGSSMPALMTEQSYTTAFAGGKASSDAIPQGMTPIVTN